MGAIGLAVGAGSYALAIVAAALTLLLLASETLLHIDQRIEAEAKETAEKKARRLRRTTRGVGFKKARNTDRFRHSDTRISSSDSDMTDRGYQEIILDVKNMSLRSE